MYFKLDFFNRSPTSVEEIKNKVVIVSTDFSFKLPHFRLKHNTFLWSWFPQTFTYSIEIALNLLRYFKPAIDFLSPQILSLEKQFSSDLPSAVQVRKSSVPQTAPAPSLSQSASESQLLSATPSKPVRASTLTLQDPDGEPYSASPRRSTPNLSTSMSSSQKYLPHKESTPSLTSDISLPIATLELQQRLHQLQK